MPSAIDVERMGSWEGNIFSNKRLALNPEVGEMLLICKFYISRYEEKLPKFD